MFKAVFNSYAFQRLTTAGLVFGSAVFAAKLLGPGRYGEIALFIFLAKALAVGNLGSVSRYLYYYYNNKVDTTGNDGFLAAYTIHMGVFGVLLILISIMLDDTYLMGVIGFALLIPLYVLEPQMRIKRKFYASLLPDVFLSIATCASAIIIVMYSSMLESMNFNAAHAMIFFLMLLCIFCVYLFRSGVRAVWRPWRKIKWHIYFAMIKDGFPIYFATITFTFFLSIDRIIIEHYYQPLDLGVYMLAYQLAIGASIFVTAQNFVSSIDIGEAIKNSDSLINMFWKQIRIAVLLACIGYAGMLIVAYSLETIVMTAYDGLTQYAAALGAGLLAFYIAGNVTAIAFYSKKQKALNIGIVFLVCSAFLYNTLILSFNLGIKWIPLASGGVMMVFAIFAILYTRKLCTNYKGS